MPLINCEVPFTLTWSENCVITSKAYRAAILVTNPPTLEINNPKNATFTTTDTKLYVTVTTLSVMMISY